MFKEGSYLIYNKNVCVVKKIIINEKDNQEYYLLSPLDDISLKITIPVQGASNHIRNIMTKQEVEELINKIPQIPIIECNDQNIENEYKKLLNSNHHDDLIKIIKTTYLRNKERLDNKKKIGDKDQNYFEKAERYLYNEIGVALNMNFDDVKKYIIEQVSKIA